MDLNKFEDEMRALDVCAKCLDETKPQRTLLRCTGCRMVLYCSKEHQRAHWQDHKTFCKARKKAAAGTPQAPHSVERSVPPLSSPRGPLEAEESETYVSICDATGVFSILGMFWRNGKSSTLCNLMVDLAKGPTSYFQSTLQDWEPRTRLAALKTLTVQGSADYVRVGSGVSSFLTRRARDDYRTFWKRPVTGELEAGVHKFLREGVQAPGKGGGLDEYGLEEYLNSEAHASFKKNLLQGCDDGESLDIFFFGLLNERREFRDCYSFLEGMAKLGGAETFEDALQKLAQAGKGDTIGGTTRLCEHACLCYHLAGLPGVASAMHIAKEGVEKDFASSPFVKAMLYRTAYSNATGEMVPSPRPELSDQYKELVLKPLNKAQEATGQPLTQLTPVSVEIKGLLEQGILL